MEYILTCMLDVGQASTVAHKKTRTTTSSTWRTNPQTKQVKQSSHQRQWRWWSRTVCSSFCLCITRLRTHTEAFSLQQARKEGEKNYRQSWEKRIVVTSIKKTTAVWKKVNVLKGTNFQKKLKLKNNTQKTFPNRVNIWLQKNQFRRCSKNGCIFII